MSATVSGADAQRGEERGIVYRLKDAGDESNNDKIIVVGVKRFGGLYCKHCEISLLREGEQYACLKNKNYFDACPLCDVRLDNGVESGRFVRVSCFEWRIAPHRLHQPRIAKFDVVDSYGGTRSIQDFLAREIAYAACPIKFYDKIE